MSEQTFIDRIGVEIECMIVDAELLGVRPLCDRLLRAENGQWQSEAVWGGITWSNELVNHLVELKITDPAPGTAGLAGQFQESVREINRRLAQFNAALMPGAMHPWMDPRRDTEIWRHEAAEVFAEFDRIFDCRTHGWANIQSVHINLPFGDDRQFAALAAATRFILPILPGLAASSPVFGADLSGALDSRLDFYRHLTGRIPFLTGRVIPEAIYSQAQYEEAILGRIFRELQPFSPDRLLAAEWTNARGCIPRFSRGTIEIRVLDCQECPAADLAVVAAVVAGVKNLLAKDSSAQQRIGDCRSERLERIFLAAIIDADRAVIDDEDYLSIFDYPGRRAEVRDLWRHLLEMTDLLDAGHEHAPALANILDRGVLARRIRDALQPASGESLKLVYRKLCSCLAEGRLF